jgi:hypothetical protein
MQENQVERRREESEPQLSNPIRLLPTEFSQIPLLPFQRICSFLNHKDVFLTLPKVSWHFHDMIRRFQMPVASVDIDIQRSEPIALVMLTIKVNSCMNVVLRGEPVRYIEFWQHCLGKFLDKLILSIETLTCDLTWPLEAVNFVNKSKQLTDLIITMPGLRKWDCNQLNVRTNLRRLSVDQYPWFGEELELILAKFPNINSMILNSLRYNHGTHQEVLDRGSSILLVHFVGPLTLPNTKTAVVRVISHGSAH